MGWIRITKEFRDRAYNNDAFGKVKRLVGDVKSSELIIENCRDECDRLGMRVTTKSSSSMKWSKMTTTFYKEIRLGENFANGTKASQAAVWAHEMVHVYQWRQMGKATFAARYLNARWRWAIEMQGYRMTVHIYELLGANKDWLHKYIQEKPGLILGPYVLGSLNTDDLRKYTREVLQSELSG